MTTEVRDTLDSLLSLYAKGSTPLIDVDLPEQDTWPKSVHRLADTELRRVVAAVTSERPLLVRGEPGVGKSHLARAAAALLDRYFISYVVQPHTEYQDLLWQFDHVRRLADAQLGSTGKSSQSANWLSPENYISPGPLWWAFDPAGRKPSCRSNFRVDPALEACESDRGVVVLIDEIDKADISLCNGLLEVLGNGAFSVPDWTDRIVVNRRRPPLVVLTSNDTRQLPSAFLRRCVLLDLVLPTGHALIRHLTDIGGVHFPMMDSQVREQAAEQIVNDRGEGSELARSGQAEYLDLLRSLNAISENTEEQKIWLDRLGDCFLKTAYVRPTFT